jgi:hypothetical protein
MSFSRRSTPRCAGGRSERQSGLSSRPGKSLSATRTSSRTEAAPAADEEDRDVAPELPHARLQLEPARAWQLKDEHEGPSTGGASRYSSADPNTRVRRPAKRSSTRSASRTPGSSSTMSTVAADASASPELMFHRVCKRHERSAAPATWAVFPVIAWILISVSRHPSGIDQDGAPGQSVDCLRGRAPRVPRDVTRSYRVHGSFGHGPIEAADGV